MTRILGELWFDHRNFVNLSLQRGFYKMQNKKDDCYKTQTPRRLNKMRNPIAPSQQKDKMLNVTETLFIFPFDCFKTF